MSIGKVKWQSIVSKYAYPETWRSIWQVLNSAVPFFVLWYLAYPAHVEIFHRRNADDGGGINGALLCVMAVTWKTGYG